MMRTNPSDDSGAAIFKHDTKSFQRTRSDKGSDAWRENDIRCRIRAIALDH